MGKIHELAIDTGDRRLVYVVLYIGTFRGMGNKLFAMPWKAFEVHATERKLTSLFNFLCGELWE